MNKEIVFPDWDNLSSVEKEIVIKWIKSLLEAEAASKALVDIYNKANRSKELESIIKDILLDTKTDKEQLIVQDIGTLFNKILDPSDQPNTGDKPYTGEYLSCLPLKLVCLVDTASGHPNSSSCQEYSKCIQNF
jgi:hypothetical protein